MPREYAWGVFPTELTQHLPIDDELPDPTYCFFRGITIRAPRSMVYQWLSQLRVAPYSYDFVDNLGGSSPKHLLDLPPVRIGDRFLIGKVTACETDKHITGLMLQDSMWSKVFDNLGGTYYLYDHSSGTCRLLVKLNARLGDRLIKRWFAVGILRFGDLIMMMKQLRTLRDLAESSARNLR